MAQKDTHTAILDRMLDDLKTTVGSDAEMADGRSDASLVSSFRSSSRSGSRAGSRSGSVPATVEDGGHVRHTRQEYRTPDNKTHVVTEKYEYDTGDTSKTKHYQKKVMKSTYSTFNSMNAGNVDDPNPPAPQVSPPAPPDTKGREGTRVSVRDSCDSDTIRTGTIRTTTTVTTDNSTLGRLRKNINELDTLIQSLEESQQPGEGSHKTTEVRETTVPIRVTHEKAPPPAVAPAKTTISVSSKKKATKAEEIKPDPMETAVSLALASAKKTTTTTTTTTTTKRTTESDSNETGPRKVPKEEGSTTTQPRTSLTNGTLTSTSTSNKYKNEDFDDPKSGEVRRIVWRNRFEKTYETQDSSHPQTMSIEDEARRREVTQRQQHHHTSTSASTTSTLSSPPQRGLVSPRLPHLQCAVYWPGHGGSPHVSPGSQSWKEPIPMPTPPQLSPREPGVAYIYTYGGTDTTGRSGVHPLPPLNYVSVPSAQSVPPSEGAPSPTPSSQVQTQPIIYHYSYHYTIQPGQPLPDGAPPPPAGMVPGSPPALQVAPSTHPTQHSHVTHQTHTTTHTSHHDHPSHVSPPVKPSQASPTDQSAHPGQPGQPSSTINYNIHSYSSRTVNRTDTTNVDHSGPTGPGGPGGPYSTDIRPIDEPSYPRKPREPGSPDGPSGPEGPGHPGSISITINKTTTRTTHSGYPGGPDGGDIPPVTSTPYSSRGRSVSPEPRSPGSPQHVTYVTNVSRTSYSDSLERVRRPKNETLPFPDTSPIKPTDNGKIPRRVDDLMTSFSDSEDGPPGGPPSRRPRRGDPSDHEPLLPHNNNQVAVRAEADAKAVAAAEAKAEPTRNKAGPPVYYPPGHELFHETMHTMTLKEGRRRGKAKWRMERSEGYKESSAHSESKGGMAMVPVCLPLCCGAACVIM